MVGTPDRRHLALGVARLALAGLATVAMTYQLATLSTRPDYPVGNFFSFFTIQSNILAVAVLCAAALVPPSARSRWFDAARGAVTLYITITGVVFALLLSGLQEELQTTIPWVDAVVHTVMPVALVVDWLIDPQRHRLPRMVALLWLAYPVAWFAFTLARGAVVDWYPYPFVDVARHGYAGVLLNAALLLAGMALAALAFLELGNRRARADTIPSAASHRAAASASARDELVEDVGQP